MCARWPWMRGLTNTRGARHVDAFAASVKHSGRLNELGLAMKTFGIFRAGIELAPMGIRRLLKRRMPPLIHKKLATAKNISRLFDKLGV